MTAPISRGAGCARGWNMSPATARLRRSAVAALVGGVLHTVAACPPASSQTVNPDLWVTPGSVSAIARAGNTLYIAGALGEVGPATGGGVPVGKTTGTPVAPYPKVTGYVSSVAPDGEGGRPRTLAKLLYDDETLYLGFECYDNHVHSTFESRDGPLQRGAIRVAAARIEIAVRIRAVRATLEGGREVDRLAQRAGRRIRFTAGVNGERL